MEPPRELDITEDVHIHWLVTKYRSIRISASFRGKTIGILRPDGWNMFKGYFVRGKRHSALAPSDNSWLSFYKE